MIRAVREELAAVIYDAVGGQLTVYDHVPQTPETPAIVVGMPLIDYTDSGTLDGSRKCEFVVSFIVGKSDPREAQIAIDDLMSSCVPQALVARKSSNWTRLVIISAEPRVTDDALIADLVFSLHTRLMEES